VSRATIVLRGNEDRLRAVNWCQKAPDGTRIEFKSSRRSLPQNDKLWASLTDIAEQLPWHGVKLKAADWKLIFMDGLNRELRIVPNLEGSGFVNLGRSSSDLSKSEMADLLTLIESFAAQHGVKLHDERVAA